MEDVFEFHNGSSTSCGSINHSNGESQIFLASDSELDEALGVTFVRYSSACFWWFDEQDILEADIAINGEFNFEMGNPPCNTYLVGHRTTIMHEMGHAFGLQHEDDVMALMMTNDGEAKYCGSHTIAPHPDDALGGRALYPSGASMIDLGASEFQVVGSNNVNLNTSPGTSSLCPGDSYTFKWSVGNRGTTNLSFNVRWYLSTNTDITTSDIPVATNTGASLSAGRFATHTRSVTIPRNVTYGTTYYLGTFVDWDNQHDEWYESNNATYMARKIKIKTASQCP
jgi:hypothetical protein